MIRTTKEKAMLVKKENTQYIVELHRTPEGKLFVVAMKDTKHKYRKNDEEKEWEYGMDEVEEIEYEKLSQEIRAALSEAGL
ncbi:MAG: hypothetical protein DRO15_03835 [Thermoprotei archaeon]|nr:MAG: hypothetical protein DRO15_03835 [Thermoprotei archaeon]